MAACCPHRDGDAGFPSRTVPLDTPAPEEACTWATASCASATATRTPATRKRASARYDGPHVSPQARRIKGPSIKGFLCPIRAACTTPRASCASSAPPASSATRRRGHRRTVSPAPALTPTQTTSELPLPLPLRLLWAGVKRLLSRLHRPGSPRPARASETAATSARRASPDTPASTANGARAQRLFVCLFAQRVWRQVSDASFFPSFSCAPGYVGNPQERLRCRPYDGEKAKPVRVEGRRRACSDL